MKKRPKRPFVPDDRPETVRKDIISAIDEQPLTAKEISGAVRISEKAVYDHLSHIQKTMHSKGLIFLVTPSECKKCGFVFKKRERLKKPGKCPKCRGESITDPFFSITSN